MSSPIGSNLWSPTSVAIPTPFTIWLTANNTWKVAQPNGIYAPPGDVLYFFAGANNPFTVESPGPGGSADITAANFLMGPGAPTGSLVGMPLVIAFDQQAFRVADGVKSGTVYAPPRASGLPFPYSTFASITIPAGELLLMPSFGMNLPSSQAFIAPISYVQSMGWNVQSA